MVYAWQAQAATEKIQAPAGWKRNELNHPCPFHGACHAGGAIACRFRDRGCVCVCGACVRVGEGSSRKG